MAAKPAESKSIWKNQIERDAFIESNCARCFQPDEARKRVTGDGPGCPHLVRAEKGRTPSAWTRRRNAPIGETYRCAYLTTKPPVNRRGTAAADTEPMFDDLEPDDRLLVPVDGWPDYRAEARKAKEGEHQ